ncbi:heterokaryon incompatibility protein-domain-containing protein [Rhypophila decipiens]|uniref:Heterokaryon incompatibility protein-domain-containing protein n=1 Tax=Rhypophila decipiens TaxID=261697 RepID=A0AAN6Y8P8_9PEZI|nr:heterokaryon incompatibility protein-domain-containing protein [Rhypophila decipiens]
MSSLQPYQYRPLNNPRRDVRFLRLLPGNPDDPIHISIFHATLGDEPKPKQQQQARMTLSEIRAKLPEDWWAGETLDGRYLFAHQRDDQDGSWAFQWQCPIKDIQEDEYCLSDDGIPCFEPQYEALSYTWGQPGGDDFVIVEEGEREGVSRTRLPVWNNLMVALCHLRRPDTPRVLWIDGICINQADDDEKGHQVQRMAMLYRGAYRVIAWLGPEKPSTKEGIELMAFLGGQIVYTLETDWFTSPDCSDPSVDWMSEKTQLPISTRGIQCLSEVLDSPWFTRLWIVQEFALANRRAILQCGQHILPAPLFKTASILLHLNYETGQLLYTSRAYSLALPPAANSFYNVVRRTRRLGCSNSRDYIYALLGLVPPKISDRIQPNYSTPVGQVYRDVALLHAKHTHRLEHFYHTFQFGRVLDNNTPSWVPDFSAPNFYEFSPSHDQCSAGLSRFYYQPVPTGVNTESIKYLFVRGKACATVSSVSTRLSRPDKTQKKEYSDENLDMSARSLVSLVKSWYPRHEKEEEQAKGASYPTGESLSVAFALTLLTNEVRERWHHTPYFFPTTSDWADLVRLAIDNPDAPETLARLDQDKMSQQCVRRAMESCAGYVLVQTHQGYMGLAPPDAREGDLVCVLLGCAYPLLLREETTGNNSQKHQKRFFKVIGPCFVHGLQDGAGLLGSVPPPWRGRVEVMPCYRYKLWFYNEETKEYSEDDPRLSGVDLDDWERIEHEMDPDDAEMYDYFRNKKTGEVLDSDPRMLPDALGRMGVELESFTLV